MTSTSARVSLRQFTSESVTEGHPDKICDQISDAVLDDMLRQDPESKVAVETMVTTGLVHVAGEVRTDGYSDIARIVRDVITGIGYDSSDKGFDGNSCGVSVSIGAQSNDIYAGVSNPYEKRQAAANGLYRNVQGASGAGIAEEDDHGASVGAGDQGLMFGYADNSTPTLMPLPIHLAHRMSETLSEVRKSGMLPFLRPDGKTQVTIGYEGDVPRTVEAVVVSSQHEPDISQDDLRDALLTHVANPVLQESGLDTSGMRQYFNPAGPFVTGGPMGDAGLTGRKIIVDTYGGFARHGGGAFSGKDPSKVDRSAAYAMRWVAKNVVAAGLADRAEVQVAYAIGAAEPVGLYVETFGTAHVDPAAIERAVREVFDLRPAAIMRDLDLKRPVYAETSSYGHFGRELDTFTWERTDRAEALRAAV
ncbi:methionine adenosyltransferase [Brevibacterium litoralis]|uniref:methionine adenosyltransferase n=1 Tax=Brevibacterium litoralis TaxID=3138935 RepID=UPI0032EA97F8